MFSRLDAFLSKALSFETVAASQTDQVIGTNGAKGDYLERLIIVPATLSPGAVSIEHGSTNIVLFAGGANSVTELKPIVVEIGMVSIDGAWEVTTGANVSVVAIGRFS